MSYQNYYDKNKICKYCYKSDHETKDCSGLINNAKHGNIRAMKILNKATGGGRVCAYCATKGHAAKVCPKKFDDTKRNLLAARGEVDKAFEYLHRVGFGPGCLMIAMSKERTWWSEGKEQRTVVIEDFKNNDLAYFFKELVYGKNRNWYSVTAIDASAEPIRGLYLPYDIYYAPKPTSRKVEIIERASPEVIEGLKSKLSVYSSPVFNYPDAASFYAAGHFLYSNSSSVDLVMS